MKLTPDVTCMNCKWWSSRMSRTDSEGQIYALCFGEGSRHYQKYTSEFDACMHFTEGEAVDTLKGES
jgi:hypothetical protein